MSAWTPQWWCHGDDRGADHGGAGPLADLTRLAERRLTQRRAAALLALSTRQVRRLYRAFQDDGAAALASRRRGRRAIGGCPRASATGHCAWSARATPTSGRPSRTRSSPRTTASSCRSRRCAAGSSPPGSGCPAPARPPQLPAAAAPRVSRRARPDRRLGARLVRRPRAGPHAARVRGRRHQPADGAVLRRGRVDVRLLPCDAPLPRTTREANGLL